MGSQQSHEPTATQFKISDWNQTYQDTGFRILNNRYNPHLQIEQHELTVNNNRDLQLAQQIFALRKQDSCLVNVLSYVFFNHEKARFDRALSGYIYTERIPSRLHQRIGIRFPECLHVYAQVIYGCQKLSKYFGFFKINPFCVGISPQGIVKIWHSPKFADVHPNQLAYSQEEMILSIFQTVEPCVDFQSMPRQEPSFKYFVLKRSQRLSFEVLKALLFEYARYFCQGVIPRNIAPGLIARQPVEQRRIPLFIQPNHPIIQNRISNFPPNYNSRPEPLNNINYVSRQPIYHQQPFRQGQPMASQYIQPVSRSFNGTNQLRNRRQNYHINTNTNHRMNLFSLSNANQIPIKPIEIRNNFPVQQPQIIPHNSLPQNPQRPSSTYDQFYSSIGKSNLSEASSKNQNNSVHSQKIEIKDKPLSSIQFTPQRSSSQQSLHFNRTFKPNSIKQRSHSDFKEPKTNPVFISFMANTSQTQPNFQYNFSGANHLNGTGLLKPLSIKQSIQGAQYRNKINLKNAPRSMIVPILRDQHHFSVPLSIQNNRNMNIHANFQKEQSLIQSPKFAEQKADPWDTIMKVVSSKPNQQLLEAVENRQVINSPRIHINQQPQIEETVNETSKNLSTQQKKKQKPKVSFDSAFPNQSISSIANSSIQRQLISKNLYDAKESESINNSTRNFYNNFEGEQFSQLAQLSTPLDFQLSNNHKIYSFRAEAEDEKSEINKADLASSKIFEIKDEFTSLQLMKQLKITQTIKKDEPEEEERLRVPEQFMTMNQRSRSKQFSKQVANLGFQMNNSDDEDDSRQKKIEGIKRDLINQWTPSYTNRYDNSYSIYETNYGNKENATSLNQLSEQTNYPRYTSYKNDKGVTEQYNFEWDPELLADIESKAYTAYTSQLSN